MRPSTYLRLPNAGKRWNARDRCLAEALAILEDSLDEHGIPSWIAQDPEREWAPDEIVDNAAAAVERYAAELRKGDGGIAPGLRIAVREKAERPEPPD